MARAPYLLPNVFVGCPYSDKFNFTGFQAALERIPFRWYYADTSLRVVDFCIFDISTWNANVALEIGLAAGLGVDYYILLNRKLSKGVPADIQGLQRIEYESVSSLDATTGLIPQLVKGLVRDQTHPRNIYNALTGNNRAKQFYFALEVLSHLRDNARLRPADTRRLCKGSYLRDADRTAILEKNGRIGFDWLFGISQGRYAEEKSIPGQAADRMIAVADRLIQFGAILALPSIYTGPRRLPE
jgi:hypothetical protein